MSAKKTDLRDKPIGPRVSELFRVEGRKIGLRNGDKICFMLYKAKRFWEIEFERRGREGMQPIFVENKKIIRKRTGINLQNEGDVEIFARIVATAANLDIAFFSKTRLFGGKILIYKFLRRK